MVPSLRFLYGYWFDHFIANRSPLQSFSAVVAALFFRRRFGCGSVQFYTLISDIRLDISIETGYHKT
jgi:hypothetical protein